MELTLQKQMLSGINFGQVTKERGKRRVKVYEREREWEHREREEKGMQPILTRIMSVVEMTM